MPSSQCKTARKVNTQSAARFRGISSAILFKKNIIWSAKMYSKSIVVKSDHQGLLCNFLVSTVLAESQAAFCAMTSADKVMTKQMFCIHTPMLKVLTAIGPEMVTSVVCSPIIRSNSSEYHERIRHTMQTWVDAIMLPIFNLNKKCLQVKFFTILKNITPSLLKPRHLL